MEIFTGILKLCAGIGLFLFAMYLLEESLKNISGRRFKLFLQRTTKSKVKAVAGGAIVTGVLQSSSMVSLMVLAFVGAGVFTMKNALALILGANLGTTLDSWMVATLGFKTNIEVVAYPAVFIGGLLLILFGKWKRVKYIAYFLFGFGLLFIGLSFMKTAMEAQVKTFDFAAYASMPRIVFLGLGFLITLLVQSSSVTMALTLTALHAGAVDFPSAAAIVLGSETGTTIKIMLSSIGGTATKKRVVMGNLLFNVFLTIMAFIFLKPILSLITGGFGIHNSLIGLVSFSTLINLLGVLLFLPFLDQFVRLLERFFRDTDGSTAAFIGNADMNEPQTALDLFRRESAYFLHNAMLLNLQQLDISSRWFEENSAYQAINERKKFHLKTLEEKYDFMKELQGELQVCYLALRRKMQDEEMTELNQLVASVRNGMYAVKSIKDIRGNIANLSRSSKDIKFELFLLRKNQTEGLYRIVSDLIKVTDAGAGEKLKAVYLQIQENYSAALDHFYEEAQHEPVDGIDITTAISFNRELFASNKAMILAAKDLLLEEKSAEDFNALSVY